MFDQVMDLATLNENLVRYIIFILVDATISMFLGPNFEGSHLLFTLISRSLQKTFLKIYL